MRLIVNNEQNDISQASAWLYRTARNHIIDRSRKRGEAVWCESLRDDVENLTDVLVDDCSVQEENMIRNMVWAPLYEALEELLEEQQEAFIETELEGLSYKELSAKTGVSIKTLLSRKLYAVIYLRSRLNDIYEDLLK